MSKPTVEQVQDEISGWPIGSGYYTTQIGVDEARQIAVNVCALFEPEVVRTTDDDTTLGDDLRALVPRVGHAPGDCCATDEGILALAARADALTEASREAREERHDMALRLADTQRTLEATEEHWRESDRIAEVHARRLSEANVRLGEAQRERNRLAAQVGAVRTVPDAGKGDTATQAPESARHTPGANAEDCRACDGRADLPYPFICDGATQRPLTGVTVHRATDRHKRITEGVFRNSIAEPQPQWPGGEDLEIDMFAATGHDPNLDNNQFRVYFEDAKDGREYAVVVTVSEPVEEPDDQ